MPARCASSPSHRSGFLLAAVTVLLALSPGAGSGQERDLRPLTLDDLLTQQRIVSPFGGEAFAFSARGEQIAYTLQSPGLLQGPGSNVGGSERADLWVVTGREGEPRRITDGETADHGYWAPNWSPDGNHLALYSNRDGDIHLHVWERARHVGAGAQVARRAPERPAGVNTS